MNGWEHVSIETLGGGVLVERFQDALTEVMSNIVDPNVESDTVREIRLTVKFKPSKDDRNKVAYIVEAKTKLAPPQPVGSMMFVVNDQGSLQAVEQNVDQGMLFTESNKVKNITLMEGRSD